MREKRRKDTNAAIDHLPDHRFVGPPCKVKVAELALHREGDVVEPVEKFILLAADGGTSR